MEWQAWNDGAGIYAKRTPRLPLRQLPWSPALTSGPICRTLTWKHRLALRTSSKCWLSSIHCHKAAGVEAAIP